MNLKMLVMPRNDEILSNVYLLVWNFTDCFQY